MKTSLFRSLFVTTLLNLAAAESLCAMNGEQRASSYEKEPRIALLQAAQANDTNAINDIKRVLNGRKIEGRPEVSEPGHWNALHYAAAANNVEMFKSIQAISPELANQKNSNGQYPIEFFPSFFNKLRCIPYIKTIAGLIGGLGLFWLYRINDYMKTTGAVGFLAANSHLAYPSYFVACLPLVYALHKLHLYHDPAPVDRPL